MFKAVDLTGQRFGRLLVVTRAGKKDQYVTWHCLCDCGNTKVVASNRLKTKYKPTRSCGCYARDYQRERIKREGWANLPSTGASSYVIEKDGKSQTLKEWSKELGLNFGTLCNRFKRGWRGEDLLEPPITHFQAKYKIPDPQFDINQDPDEQMSA